MIALRARAVHPDLAPASALPATHEQRAATVIEIALDERQRFLDAQPRAPEDHDQATQAFDSHEVRAATTPAGTAFPYLAPANQPPAGQ